MKNLSPLHAGDDISLLEIIRFRGRHRRINIPQEIGTQYFRFGACLLNDNNGARIRNMERKHMRDSEEINMDILQQWLEGSGRQPVTWATLVEVLKEADLTVLAGDIEEVSHLYNVMT